MKTIERRYVYKVVLLVLLAFGHGAAEDPGEAFDSLVEAFYSGDAQGVYQRLSTESAGMVEMMLLMVKANPQAAAEEIASEFGMEIAPDEITSWTSIDMMDALMNAPGFLDGFPTRDEIMVTGSHIQGDSCTIHFTMPEVTGELDLLMVKQNGSWKLDQSVIQAEL